MNVFKKAFAFTWVFLSFILISFSLKAQKTIEYTGLNYPKALKEYANSIVRYQKQEIIVHSYKDITVRNRRIVTIFNKEGIGDEMAYQYYDPYLDIENLEASVYDATGKLLKKYKQKDFKDQALYDGFSVYSDDRYYSLDYTPVAFPYTVVFDSEYRTSTTAFLESWEPLYGIYISTEKSEYTLTFEQAVPFIFKENNLDKYPGIRNLSTAQKLHYVAENLPAVKPEKYAPKMINMMPSVKVALKKFHLKGVDGGGENWQELGKWMYDDLISGSDDLPETTKTKIKKMVEGKSKWEAAKIIHQYVQENTRYISVQIGVGGWRPMKASEVDKLGYGDCKALTNYTKNLLAAADIASYYSVVYADSDDKRDIDEDFVAMQGNHVILAIPDEKDNYVWVDCTSQVHPFGFIGDFTDDRKVLLIKPEGGEIVKTVAYKDTDNYQKTTAQVQIQANGSMQAEVKVESRGLQYDQKFTRTLQSEKKREKIYKDNWGYLNNLQIKSIEQKNDREQVVFTENLVVGCDNYANTINEELIFCPNGFNQIQFVPDRYRNRTTPLALRWAFVDEDNVQISLPEGYETSSLPEAVTLESPFGTYEMKIEQNADGKLNYFRKFERNEGIFPKEKYEEFREFLKTVSRLDASKVVLKKKSS